MEEYEEYLLGLGLGQPDEQTLEGSLFGGTPAWHRLPHMGQEVSDGISDSESIASIGELDEGRLDVGSADSDRESIDENRNNWEVSDRNPRYNHSGLTISQNSFNPIYAIAHESKDYGCLTEVACWRA